MSYRFKSIISFFCEHYNVRNGNCFLPCVKYKSYYHCFTAIKFAKPSWRSLQSMIPFIANPTELVGATPLHLACARPLGCLKAPLGLSLLRCASQTRSIRFERSGRGQEPSRGHKFSILENVVLHRDFTSQTLASFPSDLVGACLPQTLLRI